MTNATRNKFSPEFHNRAERMVDENVGVYSWEWKTTLKWKRYFIT